MYAAIYSLFDLPVFILIHNVADDLLYLEVLIWFGYRVCRFFIDIYINPIL